MKYTKLGNSELMVSRICMGCMGFGDAKNGQHSWTLDEEHSREIIRRGLELGVNFFDTAIGYQSGTSEQYLGRTLRDFAKRDDVVVATKFLPRTEEEIASGVTGQPQRDRRSSGQSQTTSRSSKAAAETKARWTFRAATTVRDPVRAAARYSMARMHWLEPSVE